MLDVQKLSHLANTKVSLQEAVFEYLRFHYGINWEDRNSRNIFPALSRTIKERLVERMLESEAVYRQKDMKRLYYLSIEFLIGRSLGNNLINLGLYNTCREALQEMGADLEEIKELETDAGLGNGGLGRLAACFLDSMATLGLPGFGYGINYEFGLFRQEIDNGYQVEKPEFWQREQEMLQIERPEDACVVLLYGRVEQTEDLWGNPRHIWLDWQEIIGVPYDIPIPGFGGKVVNYLRLYTAQPSTNFDIKIFNEGDYIRAVEEKIKTETVSKILYPSDSMDTGRELRLIQEYFLVACSLRDIVRRFLKDHEDFELFPDKVAIHMNDTHPTLAVAELMRILVDENSLPWGKAWEITQKTLAFTNHTLLPEALEKWPVDLLGHVLPRHLQIIFEINHRFLEQVAAAFPDDIEKIRRMSFIEEGPVKHVRMINLAIVGSHSINGVSAIHTELVKHHLVRDFYELWPERFNNKTNGVTPRRWLLLANPDLADLITQKIGLDWITNLDQLRRLEAHTADRGFQEKFLAVKRQNKDAFRKHIYDVCRVEVDPDSMFDVQAKRIHIYKRQLLNAMHIIHQYLSLVEDGVEPPVAKTYIFAGKAAPGYWAAKQIIKLINNLGEIINRDERTKGLLKVVFIPDYRVSLAQKLIPAADLSEQISTAGKEASGTGNMKFALNGALTIGTHDGANIEILEQVGEDNIYMFGLKVEDIAALHQQGPYDPYVYINASPALDRVLASLRGDLFCPEEPGLFYWLYDNFIKYGGEYFHLADFESYVAAQDRAAREFRDRSLWAKKAIINVARLGIFSSDRSIGEYAREIWDLKSIN
jgi:starch phosphorylase